MRPKRGGQRHAQGLRHRPVPDAGGANAGPHLVRFSPRASPVSEGEIGTPITPDALGNWNFMPGISAAEAARDAQAQGFGPCRAAASGMITATGSPMAPKGATDHLSRRQRLSALEHDDRRRNRRRSESCDRAKDRAGHRELERTHPALGDRSGICIPFAADAWDLFLAAAARNQDAWKLSARNTNRAPGQPAPSRPAKALDPATVGPDETAADPGPSRRPGRRRGRPSGGLFEIAMTLLLKNKLHLEPE